MIAASGSNEPNKDLEEVQRLLKSAARDCVPQERNSFVAFQATTGVEVSFYFVSQYCIAFFFSDFATFLPMDKILRNPPIKKDCEESNFTHYLRKIGVSIVFLLFLLLI